MYRTPRALRNEQVLPPASSAQVLTYLWDDTVVYYMAGRLMCCAWKPCCNLHVLMPCRYGDLISWTHAPSLISERLQMPQAFEKVRNNRAKGWIFASIATAKSVKWLNHVHTLNRHCSPFFVKYNWANSIN